MELFGKRYGNAENYRIPAMVRTDDGTLVACADERFFTGSDNPNRIDKVVRRSLDGGRSWEKQITVVKETGESKERSSAAIDAALLYDNVGKKVYMLYSHTPAGIGILNCHRGRGVTDDGNRIVYDDKKRYVIRDGYLYDGENKTQYAVDERGNVTVDGEYVCNVCIFDGQFKELATSSLMLCISSDGVNYTTPINLNAQVKEEYMSFIGAGPGNGICIKNGKYAGRLVFPIYYNVIKSGLMLSNAMIYSDDGVIWKRGKSPNDDRKRWFSFIKKSRFVLPCDMLTESQLIETDRGLKLFIRNHSPRRLVATAESFDGGESWQNFEFHAQLPQCICQCSVINVPYGDRTATVFLNAASKKKRENGVLRVSFDYGKTFPYSKTIKNGEFVYSSLAAVEDGVVAVLYEPSTAHETIEFERFSIDEIVKGGENG